MAFDFNSEHQVYTPDEKFSRRFDTGFVTIAYSDLLLLPSNCLDHLNEFGLGTKYGDGEEKTVICVLLIRYL